MKPLILTLAALLIAVTGAARADDKADKKKKKGPDLDTVFAKLDANKDGKLSKDEFSKVMEEIKKKKDDAAAKKPAKGGKMVGQLFTKLDTDKDGSISKDEFKKIHTVIQEIKKDKKK